VGFSALVMKSREPLSEAALSSAVLALVDGAVMSTVKAVPLPLVLLPARSVTVMLGEFKPSFKLSVTSMAQLPVVLPAAAAPAVVA
jgi:hypothetical protein